MIKHLTLLLCILSTSTVLAGSKLRFQSGSIDPLTETEKLQASENLLPPSGATHYLVQFHEIPGASLLKNLSIYGKFLNYFPDNAYVVRMTSTQASNLQMRPEIRWIGIYQPSFKYGSNLESISSTQEVFVVHVDLFSDADLKQSLVEIRKAGGSVLKRYTKPNRLRIEIPQWRIQELAQISDIQWMERESKRELRNTTTRWVIQTNTTNDTSVWNHGIHGEGQISGHIDGLIDTNTCYLDQPGKIVAIHTKGGSTVDSHGMHTAGIMVGDKAPYGVADTGDGNAFAAKIAHRNWDDLDKNVSLYEAFQVNHDDGARVHTNSFGDDSTTSYTQDCRDIDQFTSDREDDLVIFAVSNSASITSPENAKNVLAVGASQQAPNQANHCQGGSGPTTDGRRKPEIYAPGCGINSANLSACGLASSSGTSMAAPAVAAAGMLVRQYFSTGFYPTGAANAADVFTPTGSLIKATLLNSATDMTGVSGYPSNSEGWGRVLLEKSLYFAGENRKMIARDIRKSSGFPTGSTSNNTYSFFVATGEDLRVTLVWNDVPSPVAAEGALINDLDLEVTTPTGVYKGNVFSSGQSTTGGNSDSVNNVEQVSLSNPGSGNLTIRVLASGIPVGPQGYALVVSGNVSESPINPPPGTPPTAKLTTPLDTAFYLAPASIVMQATATDSDGTISKVEFYAGTTLIATDTSSPYKGTFSGAAQGVYVLTSKSYDNSGLSTISAPINVTVHPATSAIPSPWSQTGIGGPAGPGNAIFSNNSFTVSGAGYELYNNKDSFHYVYQSLNGDGEITARVLTQQNTHANARSGVMIRETLNIGSKHASMYVTPGNGLLFQRRLTTDAARTTTNGGAGAAPYWLKMARSGSTFTASKSTDGSNWTVVGTASIPMATNLFIGLALVSNSTSVLCKSVFDNVGFGGSPPPVNVPPTVSISAPANGAVFTAPANFNIDANASDTDGTLNQVEFFSGSNSLGIDATPTSYQVTWSNVPAGVYTLTAKATDNMGAVTTSDPITVTVQQPSGALPPPWLEQDIGSVGVAGSATFASGAFTSKGSGTDIWNTADSFHYVYKPLSGNGEIIARVVSQQNTNAWAKSGVMIRETLTANSKHASIFITPVNGLSFQRRTSAGGTSTSTVGGAGIAPYWLKIARSGTTFTASKSIDGTNWTVVGSATITMGTNVFIGLAVSSHNNSVTSTAVFDNVQ